MDTLTVIMVLGGMLLNFGQLAASDDTRNLQYYSGTLTSITCSTITPIFLINGLYAPQQYDQLPGLFGITAIVAPDRSNVTLQVNGTTLAHNVTVECQNVIDTITGQKESIYRLTLFLTDPIPAPKNVQYNTSNGVFHWSPPRTEEMPDNSNVSVALRIIHYVIYVTDLQSGLLITNFTTTGPETSTKLNISILDAMPRFPCSMSIQVSAVNPAGEGQRSTSITENLCSPTTITGFDDFTTQDDNNFKEEISAERVILTNGEISAVAIVTALLIAIVTTVSLSLLMVYFTKRTKHANTTQEVTVDMKYCAAYEITTLAKEKVVMKTNPAYEQVQELY